MLPQTPFTLDSNKIVQRSYHVKDASLLYSMSLVPTLFFTIRLVHWIENVGSAEAKPNLASALKITHNMLSSERERVGQDQPSR